MDRKKRNSILKIRQTVDVLSETVETGTTTNRRVSFHNVKHVKEYDRDHGKMVDATPVKEKISETVGSDGILTPRGGNMDVTNVQLEDGTFRVFNGAGAADMSLESTIGGAGENKNLTAGLFGITREETVMIEERINTNDTINIFNQTNTEAVDITVDGTVINDTMAIFNQTNSSEVDMSMDQSVFAVPKLPSKNKMKAELENVEEEKEMDISKGNETMKLFNITNPDVIDMDMSQMPTEARDETIAMFRSPAPPKKKEMDDVEMDITQTEQEEMGSEAMDISAAPVQQNSTLAMFVENEIKEKDMSVESTMDITASKEQEMDISVASPPSPEASETLALFNSPARSKKDQTLKMFQSPAQKTQIFDESMEMEEEEEDFVPQDPEVTPEVIPEVTLEKSTSQIESLKETLVVEEERAVLQNSMMEVEAQGEEEALLKGEEDIQKTTPSFMDFTHNMTVETSEKTNNESIVKTMQLNETGTIREEEEDVEKTITKNESLSMEDTSRKMVESSDDVTIRMHTKIVEEERYTQMENTTESRMSISTFSQNMSISTSTTLNLPPISSVSKKRRSLIRDQSARESPRRMAIENSMLSMHNGGGVALAEYRQNKSMMNTSVGQMNESGNMSIGSNHGRDIFIMNTSVRSPRHQTNSSINLNIPRQPSPIAQKTHRFEMPDFDPAVTNVVYLTSDEQTIPEAVEFHKMISEEKQRIQEEIQNSDELIKEKIEKTDAKLTNDEQEAVMVARKEAELVFLQRRLQFATNQNQIQEKQIQNLESENRETAERIRDAQNLPIIKKELKEMKNHPTKSECRRIRQEYMKMKKEWFEIQMRSLKNTYEAAVELADLRAEARREFDEREYEIKQLEEENKKKMSVFHGKVNEMIMQIEN